MEPLGLINTETNSLVAIAGTEPPRQGLPAEVLYIILAMVAAVLIIAIGMALKRTRTVNLSKAWNSTA